VTGRQLSRLLGSWVWCLMLRRPALALLLHAYRYIAVAGERPLTLWPSVRHELICLMALTPLLQTDLSASFHQRVYATDASDIAAGVVATPLTPALSSGLYSLSSSAARNLLPSPRSLERGTHRAHGALDSAESPSTPTDGPAGRALHSLIDSVRWSTLVSSPWRHAQHINALELHAVLLALRHALSSPDSVCHRLFLLVDSSVAFYALWKGRSSSGQLLPVLRHINALLLVSGCALQTCWIPSAWNPADAPSRMQHTTTVTHSAHPVATAATAASVDSSGPDLPSAHGRPPDAASPSC
jgi:hypothetical protein